MSKKQRLLQEFKICPSNEMLCNSVKNNIVFKQYLMILKHMQCNSKDPDILYAVWF